MFLSNSNNENNDEYFKAFNDFPHVDIDMTCLTNKKNYTEQKISFQITLCDNIDCKFNKMNCL